MNPWLSLLQVILCVAVILGLAYWVTRLVASRGLPGALGAGSTEQFRVLARLSLGRDGSVALVQAGERYFLLGITQGAISNLGELTAQEAEPWTQKQAEQPVPPSFREALRTVIQQKKQR